MKGKHLNENPKWNNNKIQFPRIICEAYAVGAFTQTVIKDMSKRMNMTEQDAWDLIKRARNQYNTTD